MAPTLSARGSPRCCRVRRTRLPIMEVRIVTRSVEAEPGFFVGDTGRGWDIRRIASNGNEV